jgi:hypothetical protein
MRGRGDGRNPKQPETIMILLPPDHIWQSFENTPKTTDALFAKFALMYKSDHHIRRIRSAAVSALSNARSATQRLEALHMILITSEALGLTRFEDVRAILEAEEEADRARAERATQERFAKLIQDFTFPGDEAAQDTANLPNRAAPLQETRE